MVTFSGEIAPFGLLIFFHAWSSGNCFQGILKSAVSTRPEGWKVVSWRDGFVGNV